MAMKPNSIRSLSIYEQDIERLGTFRVVQPLPVTQSELERVGFFTEPTAGEFIVPKAIGPHTTINTSGRQIVRKDLPKVSQSRMVWSTWKDWHGNPHSGMQVRSQKVYERELIPPPEEALTVAVGNEGAYLVSPTFAFHRF